MKFSIFIIVFLALCLQVLISSEKSSKQMNIKMKVLEERLDAFSPTIIKADLSDLNERQIKLIKKLVDAGKLADEIFWLQTAPDAIKVRDSLSRLNDENSKKMLEYVLIQYGPYDRVFGNKRFIGVGPQIKSLVANLYPQDLTKEEFEDFIKSHPNDKSVLESQYTVVKRDGKNLIGIPYHEEYKKYTEKIADILRSAAQLTSDELFEKYLLLRAESITSDDYFHSDMAWMDMKNNDIDIVIGPIENYEDDLYNYKTAYECAVLVKDKEATKELQILRSHIDELEKRLPYDVKYIRATAGGMDNILSIMNVVYFGGDCQKAIKTIASSLPNDPKVIELKGAKKQMFKNMMEAKFDKIVMPIAQTILSPEILPFVDKKAFTGFVTLHEVSHTLGRQYVYGNDNLSVRKALKEKYSAIEEAKADILSMYNHKILGELGIYNNDYIKKAIVTYIAGLYRSIRFGGEAHGLSNLIQLNFLFDNGALVKDKKGKINVNNAIFFDKVAELSKIILTIEAEGNYDEACNLAMKYGKFNVDTEKIIKSLKNVPRDLDTKYEF